MALAAYFVSERYKQLRRERLFRDDVELKRLFRLESANILILTSTLNEQLAHETGKAKTLPSILQVSIWLNYMATGSFQSEVASIINGDQSTVSSTVRKFV